MIITHYSNDSAYYSPSEEITNSVESFRNQFVCALVKIETLKNYRSRRFYTKIQKMFLYKLLGTMIKVCIHTELDIKNDGSTIITWYKFANLESIGSDWIDDVKHNQNLATISSLINLDMLSLRKWIKCCIIMGHY